MKAHLPLGDMTVTEKLEAMEALWSDLCGRAGDVSSPEWHGEMLAARERALAAGEEVPEDWEVAKRAIRNEIG